MYRLYWARNSAAFAPEAVMQIAGLPFERITIDLARGENRSPAYLTVNPAGYVPALITPDGSVIHEAAAIVLYLCDHHGLDLAPPPRAPERGFFYRALFYMSNTLQEAYRLYYYPARFAGEAADLQATKVRALDLLQSRWTLVEDLLTPAGGPFFFGDRFSALDVYLVMLVTWHPQGEGLLAGLPAVKGCFDAAAEVPGLARVLARHRAAAAPSA